MNHEKIKKNSF